MSDYAIKIENMSKQYKLGLINSRTFRNAIESYFAIKKGKEDPNKEIGTKTSNERFMALKNISLEIKKGEAIGIIGSNGAGKSTLLKILSRVTTPSEGEAWINGRIASMLEVGTGFRAEFTGRENIYMNGMILGMSRKEIDEKIEKIIDFSECRKFIDTPVKRYSSGMYVKLAFSVAAHLDAEIMIMDEVLAVGDVNFQQKCLKKMIEVVTKENRTVLYVSHNMSTIQSLCTRCIVLDHGEIIFDGDVDKAISIYINRSKQSELLPTKYTDFIRSNPSFGISYRVISINILNKNKLVYDKNEDIVLKIKWQCNEPTNEVFFGVNLKYSDATNIGYSRSSVLKNIKKGIREDVVKFSLKNIVSGTYFFYFEICGISDINSFITYDSVGELYIKIKEDPSLYWDKKEFGHIELNRMVIEK